MTTQLSVSPKIAAFIPGLVDFLVRHKFTVKETEALLSRPVFDAVLTYIFYIKRSSHDHVQASQT